MKPNDSPLNISLSPPLDRRKFIETTSKGLLTAALMSDLPSNTEQGRLLPGTEKSMADIVSVSLPPLEQATEQDQQVKTAILPPSKRIGYALVGLGNLTLGQILPAFAQSHTAKLVALVSGHPEKARKVAAQYGIAASNIYSYERFADIAGNPEIDAVYIVLPNSMHEEYVVKAAAAGKHVLCEKPMTVSSASARRMIAACKTAGKKLMIAYRIQYEPNNRQAMEWARSEKFGKVKFIEAVNAQNQGDPHQWRQIKSLAGGGSLPDIGLYCLNTTRFILGEEPHTIIANVNSTPGDVRFREVEETVLWQMQFPSGALVNAACHYGIHQSRRYRCYSDKGGWFGLDPAFSYDHLRLESSQAQGKQEIKQEYSLGTKNQFALELDHFSACILENKEPYTPGEEGLQDHLLMEAIYDSAAQGKAIHLNSPQSKDAFRGSPPKEVS